VSYAEVATRDSKEPRVRNDLMAHGVFKPFTVVEAISPKVIPFVK
jgi:hypothetical protein